MIRSRARGLVATAAATTLICGLALTPTAEATTPTGAGSAAAAGLISATSPLVAAVATSDSTLAGLSVTADGNLTALAPAFAPATHDYQVVGNDASAAEVTPVLPVGATAVVALGATAEPLVSGVAAVTLARGRNDLTVTVTSADTTTTTVYRVTAWRLAAPIPAIVRVADAHSTVFGGTRMTATLAYGALPQGCGRSVTIGGAYSYPQSTTFDPPTGLTTLVLDIPPAPGRLAGPADLVVTNSCYTPGDQEYVTATTTAAGAVAYSAGYHVTSADIPATVTSGTVIVIHGPDVGAYADVAYWMTDSHGVNEPVDWWDFTSNGSTTTYVDYPGDAGTGNEAWYQGSGPRTFHVGYCPIGYRYWRNNDSTCTSVFSQAIHWVAPTPTSLSFSPSSGPVAGGTVITLRGRFIVSGTDNLVVKVGDQTVTDPTVVSEADGEGNPFDTYTQGQDVISFPAPASAATGPVPITVTNDIGTTAAAGTFTYSARPTITSIVPATVANSGGSVITVQGTAFGTSGRPTVIINGVKSPYVTAISAGRLTAVVPPAVGTTGPVAVSVSSSQGGGISSAAILDLVAPTTLPTISGVSPASGPVGADVTLTGTGFGAAGTAGVSVGGQWSLVTAASPTSLTFEVPPTDTTGAEDVVVGATTGAVTEAAGFTVLPAAGIATVTPPTVPSYATGAAATVALDGAGFGTSGTVKAGTGTAVGYTATASGTHIAGVRVPTAAAGSVPIVVTPTGSATPLRSSLFVTGPALTYVGPDPHASAYQPPDIDSGRTGQVLAVPTTGGIPMRVEGNGFGAAGTITFGATAVTTTSWTDTAVTFVAPPHAVGSFAVTLTPSHSTPSASQNPGVSYVTPAIGPPTIGTIASVVDHSYGGRDEFDPVNDISNLFTLSGTNLAGTSAAATQVVISDGNQTLTVVPTSVTATALTFAAPRSFTAGGWKNVTVTTNVGTTFVNYGIYYQNAGVQLTVSPYSGLCLPAPVTATGSVTYDPATVTIDNSGELFGDAGTVTVGGTAVTTTAYGAGEVVFNMAGLATPLANPWGGKSIVITPSDTTLPAQTVGFTCGVTPSVTTTANGSTDPLTVAAGTAYTLGNTTTGFIGTPPFTATAPGGYEYVTAADFGTTGFDANVHTGAPVGAGDYYVRVALSRATYATADYLPFNDAPVQVTITGTPVTITPVSDNGASFIYKGQLGDGTASSSPDFGYTATPTPADAITGVQWQYRDSVCETHPTAAWTNGLPKDVARSSLACGGDGTSVSSWDVRVSSFTMSSTGTDRSIYYQPTLATAQITITPRNLTVTAVRADKVYDGTVTAPLGPLTVTGGIAGDDISLGNAGAGATFNDPSAGVNKPVTLSQDLVLAGSAQSDYTLTNPQPAIVGTISKASAVLSLAASTSSVLLSQNVPVTITPTLTDSRTGLTVSPDANAAPVVLTSQTPTICTVTGTTVTAVKAGTCTIAGTEASSANYQAATAASDPTTATQTVDIQVYPAPQAIMVVADDLTVPVGAGVYPTSQVSGLFTGDTVDNLSYAFYSGGTLLDGPPTDPGNYQVVPQGGTLTAANASVYSNPTAFTYVAGTLVITALPPTITTFGPASGPTTGGTSVTITGTLLGTVGSVHFGGVTLGAGEFTVNQDGTTLTFTTPPAAAAGVVDFILVAGTASASGVFTYTTPLLAPPVFTADTPPPATAGSPYSYRFTASGSPTFTFTGHLPAGLTLDAATGVLSGRATTSGTFAVTATNSAGHATTPAITITVTVPVTVTVPSAPRHLRAAGGDGRATFTFTTPATDGGAAITSYQVSLDGSHWHTVSVRSRDPLTIVITGLSDGHSYTLRVRARNRVGHGVSSTVSVRPRTWMTDPVSAAARRAEVPVPADPNAYQGPVEQTRATDRSYDGTLAIPITAVLGRPLRPRHAVVLSGDGLFDFNSAVLTPAGLRQVRLVVASLKGAGSITCEGYTDYAGQASHELTLSAQRANAVCEKLIADGAHVRTLAVGYGDARPVVIGGTIAQRAGNRRVVILINS